MKKIYMVDDDVDMVTMMTLALEANGYEVRAQHDDNALVDNIREFNPDAILLDVMFPGDQGAGFRMARSIRHHDDIKNKPIIMLSAVNVEGNFVGKFSNKDIDEVYLPVTEFVDKPVDPKKLIEKIETLTAR
jgi:DNA-binding response OmpR family regulator